MELKSQIIDLLDANNIEGNVIGRFFMIACPFHDDSNPSLGVDIETGGFNCLGCGEHGPFKKLLDKLGIENCQIDEMETDYSSRIDKYIKQSKEQTDLLIQCSKHFVPLIDDNGDKMIGDIYDYAVERGLDNSTIQSLKLGAINYSRFQNRLVFPIMFNGKLVSYEGRRIDVGDDKYYRVRSTPSSNILYNYDNAKKEKNVILVEGVFDAAMLYQRGYNVVACFGSNISTNQIILLSIFDKVFLALDGDVAGNKGVDDAKKLIREESNLYYRVHMPAGVDSAHPSMTEKRFFQLLKKSTRIR